MSLRDEHLQQALKNAPDSDAAPTDAVRQKVLAYAENRLKPRREGLFKKWLNRFRDWHITSWQLVGMSTVASILFATVLLRDQSSDTPIWLNTGEQDIAQTKMETTTVSESEKEEKKKENIADVLASTTTEAYEDVQKEGASRGKVEKRATAKRDLSRKVDDVDKVPEQPSRPATVVVQTEMVGSVAEDVGTSAAARSKPSLAVQENMPASQEMPALALSGEYLARRDIQSGNLRILYTKQSWSVNKPLIDDETGYKIELAENVDIQLSVEELQSYNKVMRGWYNAHLTH